MDRRGPVFRPVTAWLAIVAAAAAVARAEEAASPGLAEPSVGWTVCGAGLGGGRSAEAAATEFARKAAARLGVNPSDLRPAGVDGPRRFVQRLRSGGGWFALVTFEQTVGGVPVVEAELRVLVREEPGHAVVLARSSLRPVKQGIGQHRGAARAERMDLEEWVSAALGAAPSSIEEVGECVWVTAEGEAVPAVRCVARVGRPGEAAYARRLLVLNAVAEAPVELEGDVGRGRVLLDRDLVVHGATVRVSGLIASDCLPAGLAPQLEERALAHARVTSAATGPLYADALGVVTFPGPLPMGTVFASSLRGRWFRVASGESPDLATSGALDAGGGLLSLVHNAGSMSGSIADTAQVNAYVAANDVRDWALLFQPGFPGLDHLEMPVNVGLASTCNAFYDGSSLNFFRAGGGCANTAYCSVVHHEYGHHLATMAGAGQGAYGEGFADVIAMLLRDDPGFAYGYHGDPGVPLRSGENTMMHPCAGDPHICGMVLSGAVWETRNRLALSEPAAHREILTRLMLASVFLQVGPEISPTITTDLLTLDDDDGDIFNGTPHYDEIAAGFAAHGLDAPVLPTVGLRFPNGRPEVLSPSGATFFVEAVELGGTLDFLTLHIEVDGSSAVIPLEEVSPGRFAARFPPIPCGREVRYGFELHAADGSIVMNPMSLPPEPPSSYRAIVASAGPDVVIDDFEQDRGWTVTSGGGLTDGAWQRGTPAALGDRGDPLMDADGSGQCWLTANRCCNSDVDSGWTTLTSPRIDVSAAVAGGDLGRVELSYSRWFFNETTGAPRDDVLAVEVSGDEGQTWVALETVGPEGPDVSGGWVTREFTVSELTRPGGGSVIGAAGTLRVRFTASDVGAGSIVEAGVDAVRVLSYPCGALCLCERDGDLAVISVFDLLAYLDAWFERAPAADLTDDGLVDVLDLLEYLDCWFDACG